MIALTHLLAFAFGVAVGIGGLFPILDTDASTGPALIVRQAVTNEARAPLGPLDWALTFKRLRDAGQGPTDIAARLTAAGLTWSRPAVSNHLRLLDLPDWAQAAIRAGTLGVTHALTILAVKDHPQVLDDLRTRIQPALAPAPNAPDGDPAPGPSRVERPAAKLTVERLQKDLHNALERTTVSLGHGGMADIDGESVYLPAGYLTDADRVECATCPSRIPGDGSDYCAKPPCLHVKITARQTANEAERQAHPPPDRSEHQSQLTERRAQQEAETAARAQRSADAEAALQGAPSSKLWLYALWDHFLRDLEHDGKSDTPRDFTAFLTDPDAQSAARASLLHDWAETIAWGDDGRDSDRDHLITWLTAE